MSFTRNQATGAYRRWEPLAFDAQDEPATEIADASPPEPAPEPVLEELAPPEPQIQLPTAADIEAMFEDARRDGFAAGFAEGAEQARQQAQRIAGVADDLESALARLDDDVAESVVALAVEIARRMVRRTLAEAPEGITDIVRDALNQLPHTQVTINLHPADLALVREYLAEQPGHPQHRLIEDPTVTQGGCRLQAAGTEIDATVETRWRRILEGLVRHDTAWEPSEK